MPQWNYKEDLTLEIVKKYLEGTYGEHYASDKTNLQPIDLIASIGDGEGFCKGNAIKYLARFGKKNGKSKSDILKAIHYCFLLYYFADLHENN